MKVMSHLPPFQHLALLCLLFIGSGCETTNSYYDPSKPHHTPQGFKNNYPHDPPKSFLTWQWERFIGGLPKVPEGGYQFPVLKPDSAFLKSNRSQRTVTWIGHATVLLQLNGVNIITDPHLTERASPLSFAGPRRVVAPALSFEELPHIDAVLISHNHYDHLDLGTVTELNRQAGGPPLFLVPLGMKSWFANQGVANVEEYDWWDKTERLGLSFHFVPVQHWSSRTVTDRNASLWGGWVVEAPDYRFIFCGDTGYSKDFANIGKRFGYFDLAAIPIGAYEPRWFMKTQHVNPDESVMIHRDLRARQSMAIHWGTFVLTDELLTDPPPHLAAALDRQSIPRDAFWVFQHGEMRILGSTAMAAGKADN